MKTQPDFKVSKPDAFNWFEEIQKLPVMTLDEHVKALRRAESWTTCACGNLCDAIPRDQETKKPLDKDLAGLGMNFIDAISYRDVEWAYDTLTAIERRAAEILAELES